MSEAGPDLKFCGAKKYNWTSGELDCCGGEAHGEVYNTKQSTCCSDGISSVIHEVKEGFHCCGTDYINGATYKCCTTKYDHKQPKPYNFLHYMCCATQHDTKISRYMPTVDITDNLATCCGLDTMYKGDPDIMCCNDKIVKQTVGQGCCADHGLFDNSTHMCCQGEKTVKRNECCQGQVHSPEEGRTACCAGTAYNPDTHSCCQDTVVNGTGQCCGKAVMDPNTDSCCQGNITLSGTYDLESELCCGPNHDVVQTKATNNTRCCGSTTYEFGEEKCCGAVLKIPAGRECCRYRGYDPRNATCCGGQVHNGIPKDKKMCCGDTMRTDQQLCCKDNNWKYRLLTKRGQEDMCCLDHDTNDILLYDSEDKVCLHGKLSFKVQGQQLCGSTYFDPREKICCSGVLHSKGDEADRMCCGRGPRAYSPSYQSCCHGRIRTDPGHIWGCCRGKFYHKNEHDCSGPHQRLVSYVGETPTRPPPNIQTSPAREMITCAGRQYSRWSEDGREKRCCKVWTYFPHNQTCCGSRVYDLPEETAGCCQGVAYENTTQCCIQRKIQNCTDQPIPSNPTHTKVQFSCSGYKHDRYDEQGNERKCCGGLLLNIQLKFLLLNIQLKFLLLNIQRTKDKYDVCNGNLFITTKEKCCDGRIRKLKKRKTECCGKWLVNPRRMDCTDNKPVKRTVTCEEKCDTKFKRRLDWKFPECSKTHIFSAKVQEELEVPLMNTNITTFILTDIDDGTATSRRQTNKNNKPLQNYLFMQVHRCQCPTFRVGRRYLFLTDANIASGAFVYDPLNDVVIRYKLDRMFLIKKLHKRGKCYGEVYYPTI
ncbi:uncharacterized protein LOC118425596 [Branchiostoma floridae]|uniref:Uncharacterized protein LOC118425596 n=1 Tax=Branchiostoma floridae TaxID=7739 RepID=A0A9J7N5L2_BRAFL|nr:uncharacterized protein LOC118425596 [Branchiostoma floridae]